MDAPQRIEQINSLLAGHTDRREEAKIIELLAEARDVELDAMIRALDLDQLFDDVDDRYLGPDNLTRLVDLLTRERVAALTIPARAALVRAFSRGHTPAQQERGVHAVLLATSGDALRELKRTIERGSDHRNLLHIVYSDVDDCDLRDAIVAHLRREAGPLAHTGLLVLSDVDDTLYANFSDKRFAKKTIYPGVRQLYRELSSEDPVFVTARPADRPGIVEGLTQAALRERGIDNATVLAGDLLHIHSNAAIATGKRNNFQAYAELFGEYDFVFIGDSGQGDASFGAAILELEPERVRAVIIHDVVDSDLATREQWAQKGVRLFDNYVGAARILHELGLVDDDAWRRVAEAAETEFGDLSFGTSAQREAQQRSLVRELDLVPKA